VLSSVDLLSGAAPAGLVFGPRIFKGDGLHDQADTWNYAYLTMIVVLAPAVLDGSFGSSADARFYDRLFMFAWATLYAVGAVYVFDALWPGGNTDRSSERTVPPRSTPARRTRRR